jgi:hypothetical protein
MSDSDLKKFQRRGGQNPNKDLSKIKKPAGKPSGQKPKNN